MGFFKNFSVGAETYKEAHRVVIKHKLWGYVVAPGIVNAILFTGVILLGINTGERTIDWFYNWIGITGNEHGWLHFLYSILTFVIKVIVVIIFFLIYISVYKYLVLIVVSPLLAVLADKTSRIITGEKVPYSFTQLIRDVWRGLLLVTRNIFIEMAFIIVCFFLSYVPVIKYACPVFLFLLSMYFYGFSMIYFSHECYRMKIRQSIHFVRRNKGFAIANGLIFYLLLMIPVVGILIAPAYSVIAATLGTHKIRKEEISEELRQSRGKLITGELPLRIAAVSYLNTLPFVYGIRSSGFLKNFELNLDVPSACAKRFEEHKADIALVPAGALPGLEGFSIIPDYCIGSNGNVKTVLLLSQVPLNQIERVYLDGHSMTSVNLVKILAKHFWKLNIEWYGPEKKIQQNLLKAECIVAIGNKTFELAPKYTYCYDLADEWHKFTGLPFVFACWIRRADLPHSSLLYFLDALKWGLDNKEKGIESLFSAKEFPGIDIHEYLEKNIDFVFNDEKHAALDKFLEYLKQI